MTQEELDEQAANEVSSQFNENGWGADISKTYFLKGIAHARQQLEPKLSAAEERLKIAVEALEDYRFISVNTDGLNISQYSIAAETLAKLAQADGGKVAPIANAVSFTMGEEKHMLHGTGGAGGGETQDPAAENAKYFRESLRTPRKPHVE